MVEEQVVTDEMKAQFSAMVSLRCSRRRAAQLLGIPESTMRNTMRRDERFAESVQRSERHREIIPLRNLQLATGEIVAGRGVAVGAVESARLRPPAAGGLHRDTNQNPRPPAGG